MSVLTYVKRVLEMYAGGGDDELHLALVEGQDHEQYALARNTERMGVLVAALLAGGRMSPVEVSPETEEEWVQSVEKAVTKLNEIYDPHNPSVPNKSELIEIGVLHFIVERLETGKNRLASLDPLGITLPTRLRHLQFVFSEAHFNYILGNRSAVAMMCGVLVESALKDCAPGKWTIDGDWKTIDHRINETGDKGLLDGERLKAVRAIMHIRNQAAHGDASFFRYPDLKIEQLLLDTRKILEDLYQDQ
jgi:hypothetical protein